MRLEEENTPVWPVLIVGGGAVGLSAALFLAWHAIPYVLIERQAGAMCDPRAVRLSPRAVELFRSVGLEDALRQASVAPMMHTIGGEHERLSPAYAQHVDADIHDLSPSCAVTCARDQLELLLRTHAEDAGGDLHFGTAMVSFEQHDHEVCAIVRERATGVERRIHARFMLVTDDSRGRIRRSLGIAEHSLHAHAQGAHIADRFQQGNIFLAGDAAHHLPSSGEVGIDIGIQGAHNLAWKLAAVIKGMAGDALLTTYEAECRPVVDAIAKQALLHLDEKAQPVSDAVLTRADYASSIKHQASSIKQAAFDQSGQPGTRAAHVVLERNGERFSTLDLFGRYFVLLAGAEGGAWRDASLRVSDQMGVELVARRVGHGGDLLDVDRRWCAAYGVSASGAVLVRPDGVIGWRSVSAAEQPEHTLARALAQLLGRE